MTHRARSDHREDRRKPTAPDQSHPTWLPPGRECPWCGSRDTVFVQRGLIREHDSKDQYIQCHDCGKLTFDIVSRNDRDIRINKYHSGGTYRDAVHQTRYTIYRMLKVGFNEFLLYVRPTLPHQDENQ